MAEKKKPSGALDNMMDPMIPGVIFRCVGDSTVYRFSFVSSQSEPILGLSQDAATALQNPFESLALDPEKKGLAKIIADAIQNFSEVRWRGPINTPSGELKWINVTASLRKGEGSDLIWDGIILDVTEEERLRQELEREKQSLQHVGRLVAIGELASGVGHEINNPLSVLIGYNARALAKLNEGTLDLKTVKDVLEKQAKASERIKKIVDGLRTFAKKDVDESKRRVSDLKDAIEDNISLVGRIYQSDGIAIATDLPEGTCLAGISKSHAQQVIMNLMSNARDALRSQAASGGQPKQVTIAVVEDGDQWLIKVTDNGPGITENNRPLIFQSFFTTKPVGEGTGIGLSLCRSVLQSNRGSIDLESTGPKGTVFCVRIPKSASDEEVTIQGAVAAPSADASGVRVLVVDDDNAVCQLLATLLNDQGCEVSTATDGVEALKRVREQHFDVIVTDLVMPQMDGLTFLQELYTGKLAGNSLKFVTTGCSLREIRDRMSDFRMGQVDGYLSKPFTKDAISALLDKARVHRDELKKAS